MTAADPRTASSWKQKRQDERTQLLLGAILDALYALRPTTPQPAATPTITRTRKANA
jgi:hypothetical protein